MWVYALILAVSGFAAIVVAGYHFLQASGGEAPTYAEMSPQTPRDYAQWWVGGATGLLSAAVSLLIIHWVIGMFLAGAQ